MKRLTLPLLALLVVGLALVASTRGSVRLSWPLSPDHAAVLLAIRIPRVVLGILVGGGLGVSGTAMQGMFRNPLVDPGLLGVSNGAALFAIAAIVLGFARTPLALPFAAFLGALLAMLLVQSFARVEGKTATTTLLLMGIAVNALATSLSGILIFMADDVQLRTITFWTLGSLSGATWRTVEILFVFIVPASLYLAFRMARRLNTLLLGNAEAGHLGTDVERTNRVVVVLVTFITGAAVAVTGVIGFVGLVVPHVLRLLLGADHRLLLPGSALLGAALLLGADTVARTAATPAELPIGVVTALLGAPFYLVLLRRERRRLA